MWSYLRSNLAPAAAGAKSLHILEKSRFGETENAAASHDEVVQHADINQCQCLDQAFGDELVGVARLLYRRRVVVDEQTCRCALFKRQLHDFARVDTRSVDRTAEEFDVLNDAVALIREDDAEDLVIEVPQPHRQI